MSTATGASTAGPLASSKGTHCYGRLAVMSDVDDGGFALNVDKRVERSAVL
jgi:hypothetical protein